MEDVLEVYQRPYDPQRPVVCLDEKSLELHDTPRGTLAMQPGQPSRQDYEYSRQGTCNLFLMTETLRSWRAVHVMARRTAQDLAEQLHWLVDEVYAHADKVVLVTDNLNTHTPACLYERFAPAEARRLAAKIEWHYTPEHGSWLNIAECELSVLAQQCLRRRLADIESAVRETAAWQQRRNRVSASVHWQFTAADARTKLRRLYPIVKEQELA